MKIQRFEEIKGWQLARQLTKEIYRISDLGDFGRDFGLRDQIRRAAVSVMSNIAEGFDAGSGTEFIRFLRYAQRSASEVQSQLYVARDLEYISEPEFDRIYELARETRSTVGGFIRYLLGQAKN